MAELTITLSDEQLKNLQDRAADCGFKDVRAYVLGMILWDLFHEDEDYGAPEHLEVKSREHLEQLVQEGLDSGPATEMTPEAWRQLRREARQRAAAERAKHVQSKAS